MVPPTLLKNAIDILVKISLQPICTDLESKKEPVTKCDLLDRKDKASVNVKSSGRLFQICGLLRKPEFYGFFFRFQICTNRLQEDVY